MKIKNVEIKNFRNITKADISFGNINVFTGRNSSGKSNFLLALSNILKTKNDYTPEFGGNNVTIGQGRKNTTFRVSVSDIASRTCFIDGTSQNETKFFCIEPELITFENILDKNSFSQSHKLFFSGKRYNNTDTSVTWEQFSKTKKFEEKAEVIKEDLVYEKKFTKQEFIDGMNIVQTNPTKRENEENYIHTFEELQKGVVSQIKPKIHTIDFGQITTALSIHKYITDKGNEQIYQEAIKRKSGASSSVKISIEKSEFIFLVSDIERVKEVKEKYYKDLNTYTKGIVKEISINSKGALSVVSPNGPDGIWTISNGTSVLVFFITLINWINLPHNKRSYLSPHTILLDETDSIVHPTILFEFIELLKALSRKVQVFITTHSPYFLDGFSTEEIYYIKDASSIAENTTDGMNRCNIYNYKSIIEKLSESEQETFLGKKNSELFCEGVIDSLFPVSEEV